MRVGTLYAVLRLETGAFDAALASSETKMARFFGLIRGAAVIAASALAAIVGGSIWAAAQFDKHMTEALAIMEGVTDDLRKQLEDAARAVAKQTTFSAREAADAFYYLAAAGFTATQSIGLLPVIAKFAQASLIDMEEATDRLAGIMTTFGLKTGDAAQDVINLTRVSDVLVKGAVDSLATMEDLADSLVRVGGTARLFGLDIEDTVAVLMAFAQQGIKGAQAGTALSIVLRELSTKAIKNADDFAAFGIAVYDSAGNLRDMADILADFEHAMVGMSDQEKREMLIKLGLTDRSNKFLLSLLGTSDAIRAYEKALREAGGYTETVAQKQLDTFISQLTIMWHKIVDVGITIGKVLMPYLTEIVKRIGNWVDANNELAGSITERAVEAFKRFATVVENRVFPVFRKIADIVRNVAHQIHMWAVRLDDLTGGLDPIARLLSAFTTGLWDVLHFFESDNGTVALALAAIAFGIRAISAALTANPIVALLLILVTAIGLLHQAWNLNVGGIQEKWGEFVKWFEENALPKIQAAFKWIDENVRPILETAFTWFVNEALPRLIDGIKWLFEEALPALGQAIQDFYDQNKDAIDRLARFLIEDFGPDVAAGIMGFGDWLVENGPTIASILGTLLGILGQLVTVLLTVASYVIPFVWNQAMGLASVFGFLGEVVGFLLKVVDTSFKEIGRVIETVMWSVTSVITLAGQVWQATLDEIKYRISIVQGAFEEAGDIIAGVWEELQRWAETAGNIIEGIINDIANAIYRVQQAIEDVIDAIDDFLNAKSKVDSSSRTTFGEVPKTPTTTTPVYRLPPEFATGVRDFAGGFAIVGERGPELVNLPRGSDVYRNTDTRELLRQGVLGRREAHVHLNVQGLVEVRNEYDVLRQLRRAAQFLPLDVVPEMRTD